MKKFILGMACAAVGLPGLHAQFTLLSNISANQPGGASAGEITAFDPVTDRLFVTSSGLTASGNASTGVYRINVFNMADPTAITQHSTIDFSTVFGGSNVNMAGLSSLALNSGKGFGVASLIPTANTTTVGKVGFFNLSTGAAIGTLDVGYHPDSVTFSPDGSKLIVVNEAEFNPASGTNAPGSISVIDVSTINSGNLANLTSLTPVTRDFSSGNLAAGVTLNGVRNPNLAAIGTSGPFINSVPDFSTPAVGIENAIEPEYAAVVGDKVYVSLQDNNAIAEYDMTSDKWTKVTNLGTIAQTIDATDTGSTISISQVVHGMPMPDTVATYQVAGKTYVVTANEGDARVDDRDVSRFGDNSGNDTMSGLVDTNAPSNFPATNTGVRADSQLGRLNVSRIDGDTDADGKIDRPTMLGTRSFSIWEVTETGLTRVFDSGSDFETKISLLDPTGWVDSRSDDKGPEPEGLTLGVIDGETYAFIGMERTNSIFMYNVSNPANATFFGYTRLVLGDGSNTSATPFRPESLAFVSALDSPNGQNLLLVGYEGDGSANSVNGERIAVFSVVPEPSTYALIGVGALLLVFAARRRRA